MADRFSGYYEHNLDPKGRITIPSRFREQLGKTVYMMRGKNCVEIYSRAEWNVVCEKFEKIEPDDEAAYDRMRRLRVTSMEDNEVDKQGRVLMPTSMRKFGGLEKDIIIAGAGRHVEVWNRDAFFEFIEG